jgi:hypothetical protein
VAGGRSSPELSLAASPGHGGLPRRHGRQEGDAGTLVVRSPRTEVAVRRTNDSGEQSSVATIGVE